MPELTIDQLAALTRNGATNGELVASLGRKLSVAERAIVERARLFRRLSRAKAAAENSHTSAEKVARFRAKHNAITRRACADQKRRDRLERHPARWLRWYMPQAFCLPWSDAHREIIDGAVEAAHTGRGLVVAAPRAEGKSAVIRGVSLYLECTKIVRFPVVGSWTNRLSKEAFKAWKTLLSATGSRLCEDYPEITQPFEISTNTARLKNLTWADTGKPVGASIDSVDKIIILPDSQGAIVAGTVNGDIKGLSITLPSGEILRPDLLMLDDAQDADRADQPTAVAETIERIESQWFCLGGPGTRMTVFIACTVKERDDVSEYWLKHPDFKAIRIPRIVSWPSGWKQADGEARTLWNEFDLVRRDGMKAAAKFYRKHKKKMTAGMMVSWKSRFDKQRGEPDAMFSAMWDYFRVGEHTFASEYQNAPIEQDVSVYHISSKLIQSRADPDRQPGITPPWVALRVAGTDVNPSYALTTAVTGCGPDQTTAVLWYGLYTNKPLPILQSLTKREQDAAVYEALVIHGKQLAALPCPPEIWTVDAGGAVFDVVLRFAANSAKLCGLPCIASTGRAGARNWNPNVKSRIGKPREMAVMCRDPAKGIWIAFNADYWREVAQRGWTGSPGAPGSCSLFAGRHSRFADQICAEQLAGKGEIGGRMMWRWNTNNTVKHDYGDSMTMCYMLAGWQGIGGVVQQTRQTARRARPSGVTVIPM